MKTRIAILTACIAMIVLSLTACAKAEGTVPTELQVRLALAEKQSTSSFVRVLIEVSAPKGVETAHVKLTMPDSADLISGSAEWDETTFVEGVAQKTVEIIFLDPYFAEVHASVEGISAAGQALNSETSIYIYSEKYTAYQDPRVDTPLNLTVAVSPAPVVGQEIRIQALAATSRDLSTASLSIELTEGLTKISETNQISGVLKASDTLELSVDAQVKDPGEWAIHFQVVSPLTSGGQTERTVDLYAQVGTKLGNTVTLLPVGSVESPE